MKLAAVPSAMATVLAALLIVAPVLVGCSSTSQSTYTFPDGSTYTGAWKYGKPNGKGTMTDADGSTYTGEFKDGKRNGQGIITDADGSSYSGQWKDGLPVP